MSLTRHLAHCRATLGVCAMIVGLLLTSPGHAEPEKPLSDAQKQEIEKLIHKYIMDHPEVILETVGRLRAEQERAAKDRAKAALVSHKKQLEADPAAPVGGNVKGDVTIVEFFDYRCGYCKRVYPTVLKAIKDDPGIRLVYKEFPILGPQSMTASRAALAVWNTAPKKYQAYHDALMAMRGNVTEARVLGEAEKLGIDKAALKKAMADTKIDTALSKNFQLAEALNITGTPAFVIGDQLVPGAVDLETLKKLVAEARGS